MRSFEYAYKRDNEGEYVLVNGEKVKQYENARLPVYQSKYAAGADFFCAEDVDIPSIWHLVGRHIFSVFCRGKNVLDIKPTLVHTGIKADMEVDEYLAIVNRSSGPKKLGLMLANSIGIIDKDYYSCRSNDGEIMFAFYNFKLRTTHVKCGDRIGQGMFQKVLRPMKGLCIVDVERTGGFGSTTKNE